MESALEFNSVSFGYEDKKVFEDISFSIQKGDYIGIVGPNGVGKSTLLKLIIKEISPIKGKIKIFGKDIRSFNEWNEVGYVNQKSNSFASSFPATVTEVVAMNLVSKIGLFRSIKKKHIKEVHKVLDLVGIYDLKNKLIGSLSGGQQQKVFIARALINSPNILILDEPTVGIDINGQREFYELLKKLNKELDLTIIIVSHDLFIVKEEVKKIALVKNKCVRIIENDNNEENKRALINLFEM